MIVILLSLGLAV